MRDIIECRSLTTTHLRKAAVLIAGGRPPPAAGRPIAGGRACASAHGDTLPLREDSGDAAPPIVDAVLIPAPSPAGGGSPAAPGLAPAAGPHGPAGAGPGASAGAGGVTEAGPDLPMSPAPPLASPGEGPWRSRWPPPRRPWRSLCAARRHRGQSLAHPRTRATRLRHHLRAASVVPQHCPQEFRGFGQISRIF